MKIFLDHIFPIDDSENSTHRKIQLAAKAFAAVIQETCQDSLQRDQAILKVREACLVACDVADNEGRMTPADALKHFLATKVLDVAHRLRPNDLVVRLTMHPKDYADIRKNAGRECLDVEHRASELKTGRQAKIDLYPFGSWLDLYTARGIAEGTYLATFEPQSTTEPVLIEADSPFRAVRINTSPTRFERPDAS